MRSHPLVIAACLLLVAAKITKAAKPTAFPKMVGCSLVRNTTRSWPARWRST